MSCRSVDTDLTLSIKNTISFPFSLSFLISSLHLRDRIFLAERFLLATDSVICKDFQDVIILMCLLSLLKLQSKH